MVQDFFHQQYLNKSSSSSFRSHPTTWMSGWKLGSMVRINGLFHLLIINGVYWGLYITHCILTFDILTSFTGHPSTAPPISQHLPAKRPTKATTGNITALVGIQPGENFQKKNSYFSRVKIAPLNKGLLRITTHILYPFMLGRF